MSENASKAIFIAVVVAVATSTTAPWWWSRVFAASPPDAGPLSIPTIVMPTVTPKSVGGGR